MAIEEQRVIELFAGPGGFSEGLATLGVQPYQALGIELDTDACLTAEAAGHRRLRGDITTLNPTSVAIGAFGHSMITGLHASPPCQGMSRAGKGKGRDDTGALVTAVEAIGGGAEPSTCIAELCEVAADPRSPLSLEPLRWIKELQPDWISLEQVPAALPVWRAYALVLRSWGYSVWAGNARSEQSGVPQTRIRAILLASRLGEVSAPVPTHSKYHTGTPGRLDPGVLPWVTMAEALSWGESDLVGFPRKGDKQEQVEIDGKPYRARDLRQTVKPSFAVTEKARSWVRFADGDGITDIGDVLNSHGCIRSLDKPAPTMTASMENGNFKAFDRTKVAATVAARANGQDSVVFEPEPSFIPEMILVSSTVSPDGRQRTATYEVTTAPVQLRSSWPATRPSTTVTGREIISTPGGNTNRFNDTAKSRNDGMRMSVAEVGILQSFRADYPWQGSTKESRYRQAGNAYPVLMAAAMVSHVINCE